MLHVAYGTSFLLPAPVCLLLGLLLECAGRWLMRRGGVEGRGLEWRCLRWCRRGHDELMMMMMMLLLLVVSAAAVAVVVVVVVPQVLCFDLFSCCIGCLGLRPFSF